MRLPFKELPGAANDFLRPVVPVVVEGLSRAPQPCLVDTGALHNRFGFWIAEAAGIDLTGVPAETIGIGGFHTEAKTATIRLSLEDETWEAPVSFCNPWPPAFNILGQEGFFRWFRVTVRAARYTLDVMPETS